MSTPPEIKTPDKLNKWYLGMDYEVALSRYRIESGISVWDMPDELFEPLGENDANNST